MPTRPRRRRLAAPLFGGAGATRTPDARDADRDAIARALAASSSTAPATGGIAEALARVGSGAVAGLRQSALDRETQAATTAAGETFSGALEGGLDTNQLATAAADPNLSDPQRAILSTLLTQRLRAGAPRDPVTLGPGQTLFDPNTNQPIFSAPGRPQSVGAGGTLVDAEGNVVFRAPAAAPDQTTDIRNFQFAQQNGFTGSFEEFRNQSRRAGATRINVGPNGQQFGNPPSGFEFLRNQDGTVQINDQGLPELAPVPGGPAALEAEEAATRTGRREEQEGRVGRVVLDNIGAARDIANQDVAGLPVTGFGGAVAQAVPGTRAFDLRSRLDTIRANIGFDQLNAMRQSSPTGGALGNVTERELSLLQATLGNLDQSQSRQQFMENLTAVEREFNRVVHGNPDGAAAPAGTTAPGGTAPATGPLDVGGVRQLPGGVTIRRTQ